MTTGQILKQDLGLSKFKYLLIQKIIELPMNVYIITVDSRFPGVYIPFSRIKKLKSVTLKRIKIIQKLNQKAIVSRPIRISMSMPLSNFDRAINSNDVILLRDLAGEYYMNKKFYESIKRVK